MKSLFCAFLFFFVSLYAVAQNNNVHYLIVNAKDGSKTTFALSNAPVVSCKADDNGNAIVNLGDMPKGIIILQSNIENIKIINR